MRRLVCLIVGHKFTRTGYAVPVRCDRCKRWVDPQRGRWQW